MPISVSVCTNINTNLVLMHGTRGSLDSANHEFPYFPFSSHLHMNKGPNPRLSNEGNIPLASEAYGPGSWEKWVICQSNGVSIWRFPNHSLLLAHCSCRVMARFEYTISLVLRYDSMTSIYLPLPFLYIAEFSMLSVGLGHLLERYCDNII